MTVVDWLLDSDPRLDIPIFRSMFGRQLLGLLLQMNSHASASHVGFNGSTNLAVARRIFGHGGKRDLMHPKILNGSMSGLLRALGMAALLAADPLSAQDAVVAGRITDAATREPVGAQVTVVGTGLGSLANAQGEYRIPNVPAGPREVRVQFIGYGSEVESVVVPPGGEVVVDFELTAMAISLEGLVVTATGEQRTREIGHSVSQVNAADLVERFEPTTLTDLLQGQATGVNIRRASGSVGSGTNIRIRGNSSIGLDNQPLVYVDGARTSNITPSSGQQGQEFSMLNYVDPEDIESIEIIKGPAAATLYGTEGAAGVLRITTKTGGVGAAEFNVQTSYGAEWNDTDFFPTVWHPRSLLGPEARDTVYTLNLLQDRSPFRTAEQYSVSASVRGGNELMRYFVSADFDNGDGVLTNNFNEQRNLRGNFVVAPRDWVDISVSTSYTDALTGLPDNDNNISGYIPIAIVSFPWVQPLEVDGVRTCPLNIETSRLTGTPLAELGFNGCAENPGFGGRTFENVATRRNELDVGRFIGSATINVRPLDIWSARFAVGLDQANQLRRNIVPVDPTRPFGDESDGFISREQTTNQNLTLEGSTQLAADVSTDVSSVSTVGAQFFREVLDGQTATGRRFPAGSPSVANSVTQESNDFFTEVRTLGIFIQQQFGWKDRLFVAPAIRFDDNSSFGEQLDVQNLKKINASWVVSEEAWFPELFETFRLRAAWGESAKQPGTNDALALLTPVPVIVDGVERLGVLPNSPGNPELKPERGEEFEIGLDATLLDGRLGVQFTYYDQTTKDAIVARDLSPSLGFGGQQVTNVGELINSGIELSVDATPIQRSILEWSFRGQLTTNDNEITRLAEPIIFDFGNDSNAGQRHEQGRPFGAYVWRPVTIGPDGEPVLGEEAVTVGRPTPRWEGAIENRLTFWNDLTLSALLDFQGGFQLANNNRSFLCNLLGGGAYGGTCPDLFERGADGQPTDEARIKAFAASIGNEAPWIEDADFAKLRRVSLSYRDRKSVV